MGLQSGKIIVYDPLQDRFLPYAGDPALRLTPIENLYLDHRGTCWASTSHGLGEYDPQLRRFTGFYRPAPGIDVRCWGICPYSDSLLIVGTENDGLYFFHRGRRKFTRIPVNEEQARWSAHAVAVDDRGKIWFTTDHAICELDPVTGESFVRDRKSVV